MHYRRRIAGFTLLELMVVMCIISVMMAVAGPRLAGRGQAAKLRGAGYDVQTLATTARTRAVLSGEVVGLILGAGGELRLVNQSPDSNQVLDLLPSRQLPEGIAARFIPDAEGEPELIRFRPDGSAEGGELLLSDPHGGELRMRLIEPMGRLQLERAT